MNDQKLQQLQTQDPCIFTYDLGGAQMEICFRSNNLPALRWPGDLDARAVTDFFENASQAICGDSVRSYAAYEIYKDGPCYRRLSPGEAHKGINDDFMRLNCLPLPVDIIQDRDVVLIVSGCFAASADQQDRRVTVCFDAHDWPKIETGVTALLAQTRAFSGNPYPKEAVRKSLAEFQEDLKVYLNVPEVA